MRIAAVVCSLALLSACGPESQDDLGCTSATDMTPILGENFTVRYQESTTIQTESLTLTFAELLGDSRCGGVCAVAGSADVEVTASIPGEDPETLQLATYPHDARPGFETEASYLGYTVELIDVVPYPSTGSHPVSQYCINLRVTK